MTQRFFTGLLALLLLGTGGQAQATIITHDFTATQRISSLPGGLASLAAPFATISGSISYDDSIAAFSVKNSTNFDAAVYLTGSMTIDQFSIGAGFFVHEFQSFVGDEHPTGSDPDLFIMSTGISVPGTTAAGTYDFVSFDMRDFAGTAFSDIGLPSSLDLSLFTTGDILFQRFEVFGDGSTRFLGQTSYNLTRVTTRAAPSPPPSGNGIPEPSTLALLSLGLVGMGAARRKKA